MPALASLVLRQKPSQEDRRNYNWQKYIRMVFYLTEHHVFYQQSTPHHDRDAQYL